MKAPPLPKPRVHKGPVITIGDHRFCSKCGDIHTSNPKADDFANEVTRLRQFYERHRPCEQS